MALPTADEVLESIATNGATRRIRTNAGEVEMQPVGDQLKLLQMLQDRERQQAGGMGFGLTKIKPGGPSD